MLSMISNWLRIKFVCIIYAHIELTVSDLWMIIDISLGLFAISDSHVIHNIV